MRCRCIAFGVGLAAGDMQSAMIAAGCSLPVVLVAAVVLQLRNAPKLPR